MKTSRKAKVSHYLAAWHTANNEGDGFAVGCEDDSPEDAARREGYEVIDVDRNGTTLSLDPSGRYILTRDVYGPWGCVVAGD